MGLDTLETNLIQSFGTKYNPKILKKQHFHRERHHHID